MKRFITSIIIFTVLLVSCKSSSTDNKGKLYLRTNLCLGCTFLEVQWIYLSDDGRIGLNPHNGVNPVDMKAEETNNTVNTGKYKIDGDQLNITWNNGTSASWKLEKKGGEISAINYGGVIVPESFPANYKFSGEYLGGGVLRSVPDLGAMNYNEDGTFNFTSSGTADTHEKGITGKYFIKGNTLTLNFDDGKNETATFAITDHQEGNKYIIINSSSLHQQK